jgi:hypothetical protein
MYEPTPDVQMMKSCAMMFPYCVSIEGLMTWMQVSQGPAQVQPLDLMLIFQMLMIPKWQAWKVYQMEEQQHQLSNRDHVSM